MILNIIIYNYHSYYYIDQIIIYKKEILKRSI